ncbi:hypothetical protein ABQZ69_18575 [Xanthomonas sp. WHRI 8391]|nr:hypothetical protein [Xanthomonas hortorum]ETC88042.1 secreted protein [Xanthomonas hortorum pv. carotae str. M081]MBG3852261.1 hypothetical protein [Xanthomonas hortorum pv. carotae]UTS72371.1 hypothetical protein NMB96_18125 [Xanthomonas hortorum]
MRMQRALAALRPVAGLSWRSGNRLQRSGRFITQGQGRQYAGRCTAASVAGSIVFTFMRTVRLSFAPRIA